MYENNFQMRKIIQSRPFSVNHNSCGMVGSNVKSCACLIDMAVEIEEPTWNTSASPSKYDNKLISSSITK